MFTEQISSEAPQPAIDRRDIRYAGRTYSVVKTELGGAMVISQARPGPVWREVRSPRRELVLAGLLVPGIVS